MCLRIIFLFTHLEIKNFGNIFFRFENDDFCFATVKINFICPEPMYNIFYFKIYDLIDFFDKFVFIQ